MNTNASPSFGLVLADGQCWRICTGEVTAQRIIAALGKTMQLSPASEGRELLAVIGAQTRLPSNNLDETQPVLCHLEPPDSDDMLTIDMIHLALVFAQQAQRSGGVLIHAALAEYRGLGVLLAGSGTVGKSTASFRLPSPWRSLCDDTTLIVRDKPGRYWAHPWPTWSRFYSQDGTPGPGGNWDVQRAVPLEAIFFLRQALQDRAEAVNRAQAAAMLMESVQQASHSMVRGMDQTAIQALYREQLTAVHKLVATIPTFILQISLDGEFWKEIERALAVPPGIFPSENDESFGEAGSPVSVPVSSANRNSGDKRLSPVLPSATERLNDGRQLVVYRGPSMNPTLVEPDLLEIHPYGKQRIRVGDVVYFQVTETRMKVVHRVVSVSVETDGARGIRTRGDHNTQTDQYWLQPGEITGQVVGAQRGQHRRRIPGGWQGQLAAVYAHMWRWAHPWVIARLHGLYQVIVQRVTFWPLLPLQLHPRVLAFHTRNKTHLKLMLGRQLIGYYELREKTWRIQRPYRLFVDARRLPSPPDVPTRSKDPA